MNRAAAEANGDILLFSDANALYLPDAVGLIVANFADPSVGCVSGNKTVRRKTADGSWSSVGEAEGFYWKYEAAIKRFESAIASTVGVVGEMLAVRHSSWRPIPADVINDDFYACLMIQKLGQRVIYEHNAVSWELPSQSLADDLKRRQRITAGRFQALFHLGWWPWNSPLGLFMLISHKFLRLLLPVLFVLAFGANLALLAGPALPTLLAVTLWAQLAFYALVVAGLVGDRLGKRWRLPGICYYIFAGNIGTVRGFMHFLSRAPGVLWEKAAR
jgi:cellulose synthase/poly-beta-1,6-N-acetylglucosamine synthase-like glycosyltransferase